MTASEFGVDELRALAASVPCGVAQLADGCIAWANERLVALSGRSGDLVGLKLADLLIDAGDGLPGEGEPRALECVVARPDGSQRTVVCRPVGSGDVRRGRSWVIEDVTHVRRLELELLHAGQELSRANRAVLSHRERLRSERSEREELLSVVSHELRTPVTVISGYNRLLLAGEVGPLTEDQRRFLEESNKSCRRLDSFIGNLLEASRAAKGEEALEIGRAPLAPLIEGVAEMFRPMLEEQELSLSLALDPDAPCARFDRLRIEQVLTNLVGNAMKFTPSGGAIGISTRGVTVETGSPVSRWVEISVTDDGHGVAPEDRERIFEPYVQAGEESRAGGLGLGLAICRRLVEAHGGAIDLVEATGGGCHFRFTLPATESGPAGRED